MLSETWLILVQLSPWLLLGMAMSALLELILPAGFIRRRFQGFSGVLSAVAIGVPLPLCSCGVVPAGIGLKNQGADDGAAVGFIISTPQTGVDSVLVAVSFFGWPFALFKMFTALVLGVIGGLLANCDVIKDESRLNVVASAHSHHHASGGGVLKRFFIHCYEVFKSFWFWLVIGVLVSAAIKVMLPEDWSVMLSSLGTLPLMLVVLLISVPTYICATASVPLAAVLVEAGFPPAAAMVFLMAGPATNTTTIGAVYARFGIRTTGVYLAVIVLGSIVGGLIFDWLLSADALTDAEQPHHHLPRLLEILSVLVVVSLSGIAAWQQVSSRFSRK